MNIYEYLLNGNKRKPFSEADVPESIDSASSFSDFIPEESDSGTDSIGDDFSTDGFDMGGEGLGDDFGQEGNQSGKDLKSVIYQYIDTLEEDEKQFNEKILQSFGDMYEDRKSDYQRLNSENLDSSDTGETISKLRDQYESTLSILRVYILEKCLKDTTYARTMTFIEFKNIFNDLNKSLNDILNTIK